MEDIMSRLILYVGSFLLVWGITATSLAQKGFVQTPHGVSYKELKIGQGAEAQLGDTATIHFVGWLSNNGKRGKEIYNSRKEKKEVSFVIGTDKIIQGWNEGVIGMKAGGSRLLRIPPEQGYGVKGVVDVIPPNAPLIFIVQLIKIE